MSDLRPVDAGYDPGYPRRLTAEEIERLLRPGLWERFGAGTMAVGALAAGLSLAGCTADQEPPKAPDPHFPKAAAALPKAGLSTRTDAKHRDKVERIAHEILGNKVGEWNHLTSQGLKEVLKANPPVRHPIIPIMFGNSRVGILDADKAKIATHQLFAAWGIELKKEVPLKSDNYQFVANGYNRQLEIGFKIILPEGSARLGGQKFPTLSDEQKLDAQELQALNREVERGKLRVFVANGSGFPNMDGDLYTPMQYYLASVIDYLNWVHGERQIDTRTVLGKTPAPERNPIEDR
jgi:hypothetical protein